MQYSVINKTAKRQQRRKVVKKIVAVICVLIIIAVAIALWVYWKSMTPTILDIAESRLTSETIRMINEAVSVSLSDCKYQDLITVEKNENGEVALISANSSTANILARKTANLTQSKINELSSFDVNIPLGTLSGVPLLSEKGPKVNIEVTPIGTVTCSFVSTFETAGINQTLHRIYINVDATIDIIIPSSRKTVQSSTPILLCESVIVGSVPQTFLQGGLVLGASK